MAAVFTHPTPTHGSTKLIKVRVALAHSHSQHNRWPFCSSVCLLYTLPFDMLTALSQDEGRHTLHAHQSERLAQRLHLVTKNRLRSR